MYAFNYHKVTSLADAQEVMGKSADGKYLAGGQTMLPTMKHRLASPEDIIDLAGIAELRGIDVSGDVVTVGAMTTHAEVASSPEIAAAIPALADLASKIGDPAVRNRGTLGGSIANNDPAADYPAAVIALGATIVTSKREIQSDDFFTGMFETALEEDEIILRVRFPKPDRAAYAKFEHPASRYAIVGVFVAKTDGTVRIGVTGATACAHRGMRLEEALNGTLDADTLDAVEIPLEKMNADMHASAEYRAQLVKVMARRAIEACH